MGISRSFFLFLSRSKGLRKVVSGWGLARRAARRFVAGETAAEAIEVARGLSGRGIMAILDHLGENVSTESEARAAADAYIALIDAIAAAAPWQSVDGGPPHLAVKLTQLGLDLSPGMAEANLARMAARAKALGVTVAVDMESSATVDQTLAVLNAVRAEYGNVSAVVQSYLRRNDADIETLCAAGYAIRLVKGAYQEPAEVAYPEKADVDAAYVRQAQRMLRATKETGAYAQFGTQDPKMIAAARDYAATNGIPASAWEVQMLHGVRRDLQDALAREGVRVRIYIPYGTEWYPYFMRRLAERPANVWFLLKNAIRK
jgi:proline dehydrogenase